MPAWVPLYLPVLLTSTALNLLVAPVAFNYMLRFEQWLRRLVGSAVALPLQSLR